MFGLVHWVLAPTFAGVRNPLWALLLGGGAIGALLAFDARLRWVAAPSRRTRWASAALLGGASAQS